MQVPIAILLVSKEHESKNEKQYYSFKAFLKALTLLQSTVCEGKEFHTLKELIKMKKKRLKFSQKAGLIVSHERL